MPQTASSTSSSSLPSSSKQRKRRWTREQLLRNLEMIGDLAAPLPPTLPPSPPASRAASPAAGSKRKLAPSSDPDAAKRPRTSSLVDRSHSSPLHPSPLHQSTHQPHYQVQQQLTLPPSISSTRQVSTVTNNTPSRSEPCEDGEVSEEQAQSVLSTVPAQIATGSANDVPIRRPKKGKPIMRHFDALHDKYHAAGRMLKYSGDARFWSTFPAGHREFRPLANPPEVGSPYHKHGGLIARLELLDALVCFTFSIWNRDIGRRTCFVETWSTIVAFLGWCKQKWQAEEGSTDAEKAFLGLIWMIEGFIKGRQIAYSVRGHLDSDMDKVVESTSKKIAAAATTALAGDPTFSSGLTGAAPPMLPSPSSTNSTPVNRGDGTPSSSSTRTAQAAANAAHRQQSYTGPVPFKLLPEQLQTSPAPIPPHVMDAMEGAQHPISSALVQNLKDLTANLMATSYCLERSQLTLNLPVLRRCFPHTWTRMMHSTLLPNEEHEPEFEDQEGELYWPDQCISGEGLGWVCLMGKAMINEFGKAYGYKSVEGAVPKPKPEERQRQQRSGPPAGQVASSSSQRTSVSSGAPR
ncbi:hypothetical protein CPB83DRAFT_870319 [Crepidotus variabilis]|uniref:Uncharacterized protein n=1 Tax=Crepidotus variabilis TaxID=179855 RepID=A0A9P6ECM5_9AGAR|nr:hypothetical protein CPB83DRAFT_870319 [Crepidotus variabilis]